MKKETLSKNMGRLLKLRKWLKEGVTLGGVQYLENQEGFYLRIISDGKTFEFPMEEELQRYTFYPFIKDEYKAPWRVKVLTSEGGVIKSFEGDLRDKETFEETYTWLEANFYSQTKAHTLEVKVLSKKYRFSKGVEYLLGTTLEDDVVFEDPSLSSCEDCLKEFTSSIAAAASEGENFSIYEITNQGTLEIDDKVQSLLEEDW